MNSGKIKLTILLVAIILPITAATLLFMMKEGQGFGSTTNKGHLINPVLDITEFGMKTKTGEAIFLPFEVTVADIAPEDYVPRPWGLVYLGQRECDQICEERITYLRQLHRRLGAEATRVARYYINTDEDFAPQTTTLFQQSFPEMTLSYSNKTLLKNNLARTHAENIDPIEQHYIYVVDPVGNVMLYFTPENTPEEILSDLDKLLDQSSLG